MGSEWGASGAPKGGSPNPEKWELRRGGAPKGWVPEGVEPRRVGGQKFRVFFFPLPPQFSLFLPSLGGLLVEFWLCLKRRGLECARLEFSGCHVKLRRPQSSLQNTTKTQREDPQEREERKKNVAVRGKKKRNFGRSWRGAVLGKMGSGRGGGQKC